MTNAITARSPWPWTALAAGSTSALCLEYAARKFHKAPSGSKAQTEYQNDPGLKLAQKRISEACEPDSKRISTGLLAKLP
jgi:hypothetical protein